MIRSPEGPKPNFMTMLFDQEEPQLQSPMLDPYLSALFVIRSMVEEPPSTEDELLTMMADVYMIANEAIEHADEE